MNEGAYLALATISGEIWGTQARAHMSQPVATGAPRHILSSDVYFEIFNKLKADFRKEVEPDEAETPDGEDD